MDPKNMTVLVVDDFATMRRIVKGTLKELGFRSFVEAENGKMALSELGKERIDLVISDWNMPEMTGIEFLKAVRSNEQYKDLPFVMVTAEGQKENVMEAIQAGVSNYIVKPFTPETLRQKLESLFK